MTPSEVIDHLAARIAGNGGVPPERTAFVLYAEHGDELTNAAAEYLAARGCVCYGVPWNEADYTAWLAGREDTPDNRSEWAISTQPVWAFVIGKRSLSEAIGATDPLAKATSYWTAAGWQKIQPIE